MQAQRCQQAATAQPRPPGQGAEGPCPWRLWSPCVPPPPLSAAGRPPAALCLAAGSPCRDMVLSPGSPELGASSVPLDMIGIDDEKQESRCSLHASPGRTEHGPSPAAFALLPASCVTMAAP